MYYTASHKLTEGGVGGAAGLDVGVVTVFVTFVGGGGGRGLSPIKLLVADTLPVISTPKLLGVVLYLKDLNNHIRITSNHFNAKNRCYSI